MEDAIVIVVGPAVAATVGLVKMFGPAKTPPAVSLILAGLVAATLIGLGLWSGEVSGQPLELVGRWFGVVLEAVGARELFRRFAGDDALRLGIARSRGVGDGGFPTGDSSR